MPPAAGVVTLLSNVTSTGPGNATNLNALFVHNTINVSIGGANPDEGVIVRLEGSLDGTNWFALCEQEGPGVQSDTQHTVQYVRANVMAIASGTVSATSGSA